MDLAGVGVRHLKVAKDFNLVFLHVPKTAGLSIKQAMEGWSDEMFEDVLADMPGHVELDMQSPFRGYLDHPELGSMHMDHIPLPVLRTHFPTAYKTISRAELFAVLRNPEERFLSAISQHLREFKNVGASHITDDLIRETAREMIGKVGGRGIFVDRHDIHFAPQSWFVEDPQAPLPARLFAIDRMDVLARWLTARTGKPIDMTTRNATVLPKSQFVPLHAVLTRLGKLVPRGLASKLRPLVLGLPMYRKSWSGSNFRFDSETRAFIADFYKRDFELYEAALRQN